MMRTWIYSTTRILNSLGHVVVWSTICSGNDKQHAVEWPSIARTIDDQRPSQKIPLISFWSLSPAHVADSKNQCWISIFGLALVNPTPLACLPDALAPYKSCRLEGLERSQPLSLTARYRISLPECPRIPLRHLIEHLIPCTFIGGTLDMLHIHASPSPKKLGGQPEFHKDVHQRWHVCRSNG